MKKIIKIGVLAMSILSILPFSGCKQNRTATLKITGGTYVNTSVATVDEEDDSDKSTPAPNVITVKEGDEFKSLKVEKITSNSVTVVSDFTEYFCVIREDGHFVKNVDDNLKFTAKTGQTIDLSEMNLMDESYSIGITIEKIE